MINIDIPISDESLVNWCYDNLGYPGVVGKWDWFAFKGYRCLCFCDETTFTQFKESDIFLLYTLKHGPVDAFYTD